MGNQIVEAIRQAGVVGAGGAGLPTHVKADASVGTVLVNGASCEPLLMSDPYLLECRTEELLRGLQAMMDCTGAQRGVVCLKGKHAAALRQVRQAVADRPDMDVFELGDFYPAGDEQVMVYEVLGAVVPERGLPLQVGAVVSNVESLCNVARALEGKPVTHRYLTVGCAVARPMVLRVPVGTCVDEVLRFAGGPTLTEYKVVDGGPMMGRVLPHTQQPVTKTTSGLLVLPPDHTVVARKIMDVRTVRRLTNTVCCQCSLCTDLCRGTACIRTSSCACPPGRRRRKFLWPKRPCSVPSAASAKNSPVRWAFPHARSTLSSKENWARPALPGNTTDAPCTRHAFGRSGASPPAAWCSVWA